MAYSIPNLIASVRRGDLTSVKNLYPPLEAPSLLRPQSDVHILAGEAIEYKQNHIAAYFLAMTDKHLNEKQPNLGLAHEAIRNSNIEALQLLHDFDYNLNARGEFLLSPIELAICSTNIDAIRKLIGLQIEIPAGKSLLSFAVYEEKLESARCLLELKSYKDWQLNDSKCNPLAFACKIRHYGLIKLMLEYGADPNCFHRSESPILIAVKKRNLELTKLLLDHGANPYLIPQAGNAEPSLARYIPPSAPRGRHGESAFAVAAKNNDFDMIKLLLVCDFDLRLKDGQQPIHEQSCLKNRRVVATLLDASASVHSRNSQGLTPLHCACYFGYIETFELLLFRGSDINAVTYLGNTILHFASRSSLELTRKVLDLDFQVSKQDILGRTALHYATLGPNLKVIIDVIELLVERLAQQLAINNHHHPIDSKASKKQISKVVNLADVHGLTALHHTVNCVDPEDHRGRIMRLQGSAYNFMEANLDFEDEIKQDQFESPIYGQHRGDISKLIEHGADPNARSSDGRTPIHMAALGDAYGSIEALAETNADLNSKDHHGNTALHYACQNYNFLSMKSLLGAGADLTIQNHRGHVAGSDMEPFEFFFELCKARKIELKMAGLLPSRHKFAECSKRRNINLSNRHMRPRYRFWSAERKLDKKFACKAELEQLKGHLLRPDLSLFDWLTEYRLEQPLYVRNCEIVDKLQSIDSDMYPNYCDIIKGFLRDDRLKLAHIRYALKPFDHLISLAWMTNKLPPLPVEICDKILAHCTYSELRTFIEEIEKIDNQLLIS